MIGGGGVVLTGIWFHDGYDLADRLHVRVLTALTTTDEVAGEAREYAGGVRLATRRPGQHTPVECTIRLPRGRVGLDWLREHTGRMVQVRDFAGGVVWGVYWRLPRTEIAGADMVDITLTIEPVTAPTVG